MLKVNHNIVNPASIEMGKISNAAPKVEVERASKAGSRSIADHALDIGQSLWNSRILRHILFATGVALAIAFFATPPGWSALGVSAFAALAGGVTCVMTMAAHYKLEKLQKGSMEKLSFEITAIPRIFKKDFNQIIPGIYLGAMPSRMSFFRSSNWDRLRELNIGAILSINDIWEKKPRGPSIPYAARDCKQYGIAYMAITSPDHQPLNVLKMDRCANFIHDQMNAGKKVYVHCRAGRGRSAMAVAAYLIKYRNYTVEQAENLIKARRRSATIRKKTAALHKYAEFLRPIGRF